MWESGLDEMIGTHQVGLESCMPILNTVFDAQTRDIGDYDVDFARFCGDVRDPYCQLVSFGYIDYGADDLEQVLVGVNAYRIRWC